MSKKFASKTAALVAAGSILLTASSANAASLVTGQNISGSGSSFAYNGINKCISLYDANNVTYTSTGSGTGRDNFRNNSATYSYAMSDGLYTAGTEPNNPLSGSGYTMAALFGGPVVLAYGRSVPAGLKLDAATVSGILKGTITTWDAAAIKKINTQFTAANWTKLKGKAIKVFYRNVDSGTTENVTNYLAQVAPTTGWTKAKQLYGGSNGAAPANAVGKATSAMVADAVEANGYGFGYFDLSDGKTASVRIAALKNARGQYIAPSSSSAAAFLNAQTLSATGSSRTDGTMTIDFTKSIKGAYQLTIVTYGIAPKASTDSKAKAVEDFFNYVVTSCMPSQASRLGYVALTGALKTNALAQIAGISN